MKKMKRNLLFVPFVAVLTLLVFSALASAQSIELAEGVETTFNGVDLVEGGSVTAGMVGNTVPVRITFDALEDQSDVRVKVTMEGHREDIEATTQRFDIVSGVTYTKLLSLSLPSDLKDTTKEFTLDVEIVSADGRTELQYSILMQRESYDLSILAVDYNSRVAQGEVVPVVVVTENSGYNVLEDLFVAVSIPELGIFSRTFIGDLIADEDNGFGDDELDSISKTLYFKVPTNAQTGVYDMEVTIYNDDTEKSVVRPISVGESAPTTVYAAAKNKDINAGETVTYELIVVNSGDNVKVLRVSETSGEDLSVSVPAVVTVGPRSSATIEVSVTASEDASVGTRTFTVDVDGSSVVLGANITGDGVVSNSVVALTVILVIVFIVLLAVLIILLTRKEKPMEEVETSYY